MDATLTFSLLTMAGLGVFFAGALAIADRKLRVEEDPRINQVNDVLPAANCGACGEAGCMAFAVSIVEGRSEVNGCPVGGAETAEAVAAVMGVDAGDTVKLVARVHCRGGKGLVQEKATYDGPQKCSARVLVAGGEQACMWGCVGGGDCVTACQFDAIFMNDAGLPVVIDELCTGCGACARACPRSIITMHPNTREHFVFCSSHDDPKTSRKICQVACIGCGICARKVEESAYMDDGLAVIDYEKLNPAIVPFEKCPTKAIGPYTRYAPQRLGELKAALERPIPSPAAKG